MMRNPPTWFLNVHWNLISISAPFSSNQLQSAPISETMSMSGCPAYPGTTRVGKTWMPDVSGDICMLQKCCKNAAKNVTSFTSQSQQMQNCKLWMRCKTAMQLSLFYVCHCVYAYMIIWSYMWGYSSEIQVSRMGPCDDRGGLKMMKAYKR